MMILEEDERRVSIRLQLLGHDFYVYAPCRANPPQQFVRLLPARRIRKT